MGPVVHSSSPAAGASPTWCFWYITWALCFETRFKSFTKELLRAALAKGLQIFSPAEASAGVISSYLGTSLHSLSCVALSNKTRLLSLSQTLPLDHFFLAFPPYLFTGFLSFFDDFPESSLLLGSRVKLREHLLSLLPPWDVGPMMKHLKAFLLRSETSTWPGSSFG